MFYKIRRAIARYLHPEAEQVRISYRETEARLRALLEEAQDKASSLSYANKQLETKVDFRNTAVQEISDELASSRARLQICELKAANWDHLVKSHESGELEGAFVVCRLDEQGVLSPITCQKDELSAAVYIDRTKHGAVKAN